MQIRTFTSKDIPQAVKGWNNCFIYDQVTEQRFRHVVFDDPNYEADGNLAATDNDEVIGFVSAVAREGIAGRDGRGRPEEMDYGYIKGLYLLEGQDIRVKQQLLKRALDYLRSKGKRIVRVLLYTGHYFFPGIDIRYETELSFYESQGFQRIATVDDVAVDLTDFQPTEYQQDAQRRMQKIGVKVVDYQPSMLTAMRAFVEKIQIPHWFPEGWEQGFGASGHTLVARKENDVVGWANYWPHPESGGFGPIAVLPEFREHGIGTCLLMESMLRMQRLGTPKVVAGWAATGFYLKSGWYVCRQYIVFQYEFVTDSLKKTCK
ncbi:MAG: GNAT family N-acetyltransferase [Candidatus Poribacteria bacterium]